MAAGTPTVYPPVTEIPLEEAFNEGDKPLIELIGEGGMAIIDAMVGHTDEDEHEHDDSKNDDSKVEDEHEHDDGKKDDSKVEHCEPLVESPPKRVKLGH